MYSLWEEMDCCLCHLHHHHHLPRSLLPYWRNACFTQSSYNQLHKAKKAPNYVHFLSTWSTTYYYFSEHCQN